MRPEGKIAVVADSRKVTIFEQALLDYALKTAGFHGGRVSVVSDNN